MIPTDEFHAMGVADGGQSAPGSPTVHVFGVLSAEVNGQPIPLGGHQERVLLAALIVHRDRPIAADRLVDIVWPDASPPTAVKTIQVYVSRLRRRLGPAAVLTVADGYLLRSDEVPIDVVEFEAQVQRGLGSSVAGATMSDRLQALERAVTIARGEPFNDVRDAEAVDREAVRLEEIRSMAQEERFELMLELGRQREVVAEIGPAINAQPLRERLRAQQMLALYRVGRQAEALDAFHAARRALREELGLEPGPELQSLQRRLLVQDPELDAEPRRPSLRAAVRVPQPPTTTVGRDGEVAHVVATMRSGSARLITLTGPGGSGKTRVAIEAARRLESSFPGSTYFVDLSSIRDPGLVGPAMARALGLPGDVERSIADDSVVIVLDNLEQVPDVGAGLESLLATCPNLRIIATSRVALGVRREIQVPIGPLSIDDAVEVFDDRARAVDPTFVSSEIVGAICERLDRLPLAIELAAGRVGALSMAEILGRLGRRFAQVPAGPADAPERHRSLEAAIGWSYDLLSPSARSALERLAIFRTWTVGAAESAVDVDVATLSELVRHSLVQRAGDRYRMLETIREFALARLAERSDAAFAHDRHAGHFLRAAVDDASVDGRIDPPFDVLADDLDNVAIAFERLIGTDRIDEAADLAQCMWRTWFSDGRLTEGRHFFDRLLKADRGATDTRWVETWALAGEFARLSGDFEGAELLHGRSLDRARARGYRGKVAASLTDLGEVARARGEIGLARSRFMEALELRRALGLPHGIAHALVALGDQELDEGRVAEAAELFEEAAQITAAKSRDEQRRTDLGAAALLGLGRARLSLGQPEAARGHILAGLALATEIGIADLETVGLELEAALLSATDRAGDAARVLGVAARRRADSESRASPSEIRRRDDTESAVLAAIGPGRYRELFGEGLALSLEDAVRMAEVTP